MNNPVTTNEDLQTVQTVIAGKALALKQVNYELKEQREMLKNIFENDTELGDIIDGLVEQGKELTEMRAKISSSAEAVERKIKISELNDEKKEIEESLSNHLISYYKMTNSKSVSINDGPDAEFDLVAKFSSKQLSLFD